MSEPIKNQALRPENASTSMDVVEAHSRLWGQGQVPDLKRFLAGAGTMTVAQARDVFERDQWERWHRGDRIPAEEYLRLLPPEAGPDDRFALVYGEFLLREELGEPPDTEEYLQRFPDHADRLRQQLDLHRAFASGSRTGPASEPTLRQASQTSPQAIASTGGEGSPEVPGYEIVGELGRGGMGVVYQARHTALGRWIALKVLRGADYSDDSQRSRFRREAVTVARLQHPHVVQIFEVGEHKGQPYLALEFVEGGSLAQRIATLPQPPQGAALLVAVLARAVDHAHAQGIVHRDLKPANILLTKDGTPKITDFGLARQLDAAAGQTESDAIVGTAAYMAPEQAAGKGRDAGPAADIYGLGAILYEMLTGRPPFQGDTPMGTLLQVLSKEPIPPCRLQGRVPRDLETICLKCLAKDPTKRYSTAQSLAEDLDRFLTGQPIQARRASTWERIWKWARRERRIAAAVAVAIGIILAASWLISGSSQRADREANRVEEEKGKVREKTQLAEDATRAEHLAETQRMVDRALSLLQEENYGPGMLWLVRALERSQSDPLPQQELIRRLLDGWGLSLHLLRSVFVHDQEVLGADLSPDGTILLTRGLQWFQFWNVATGKPLGPPIECKARAQATALSPDGKIAAVAVETITLWDLQTGRPLGRAMSHGPANTLITCLTFSPDGSLLASGGRDNTVRLWQVATAEAATPPLKHNRAPMAIAFHPDGQRLLTVSEDRIARQWSASSGAPYDDPLHNEPKVAKAVYSRDGQYILASYERSARVWETISGKPVGEPMQHNRGVDAMTFSPDGLEVLTVSWGTLQRWETRTGKPTLQTCQIEWPTSMTQPLQRYGRSDLANYSFSDKAILGNGREQRLMVWDAPTGKAWGWPVRHQSIISAATVSSDGMKIVTASHDHTVRIWDLPTSLIGGKPKRWPQGLTCSTMSPEGERILLVDHRGARLIDTRTGEALATEFSSRGPIKSAVFSPDGNVILTELSNGTSQLWNAATGRPMGEPMPFAKAIFSVDGKSVVVVDDDKTHQTVRSWDAATGKPQGKPLQYREGTRLSPDGRFVAAVGEDQMVRVWEVATGSPMGKPIPHRGTISVLAFSPDGKSIAIGGGDFKGRVWNISTGEPIGEPLVHPHEWFSVAFSPDGKKLLTESIDHTVQLWDIATGKPVGAPLRHPAGVYLLGFGPGGDLLWTKWRTTRQGLEGSIRFWDAATGMPLGLPVPEEGFCQGNRFTLDGQRFLVGGQLWKVPRPLGGDVQRLKLWAEVNSGMELVGDRATWLDKAGWDERYQRLQSLGGSPDF